MEYITVIGAANMDICAKSFKNIIPSDSNPGIIFKSPGGVARNIAENLARLGADAKLIAPLGDDLSAKIILDDCAIVGIDTKYCHIDKSTTTPTYVAIVDNLGEMRVAVMDSSCTLPIFHVERNASFIRGSAIIILDTNLEQDMLAYITDRFEDNNIYVDTISVTKAEKIRPFMGKFHTVKMNQMEASALANIELTRDDDFTKAGEYFINKGVKRVIISRGSKGLYYQNKDSKIWLKSPKIIPINSTGAGDALMAGIAYCSLLNMRDTYTAKFAVEMARLTLLSDKAVSLNISFDKISRHCEAEPKDFLG